MVMKPALRKFVLTAHIACSAGWIGAVLTYLSLVALAWTSQNLVTFKAAWIAMEWIGWKVIVPLACASLFTGLVMALGTRWGLFRHYWVLISFLLTIIATIVLVDHMQTVSFYAGLALETENTSYSGLPGELFHAGTGLLVLLVIQTLNVYKPRGLTPYGWRKQYG